MIYTLCRGEKFMIARPTYIEELKKWQNKDVIKVITGMRRCGKSTLFDLFIEELKLQGIKDNQIIHINLEDADFDFQDYKEFYNYVNKLIKDEINYYVFLDEVQMVKDFQKVVDSLYIKKNVDVYIIGSNSTLLSGELATLLSGRYIKIEMLPLSFKEYVSASDNTNYQNLFLEYMQTGGLPGVVNITDTNYNGIDKYLDGIFSTVVYKDIMTRENSMDKLELERILKFIYVSIGSQVSINKISNTLTSKGMPINYYTVDKYINAFLNSYLIYKAECFDIQGKKLLEGNYKFYSVDMGLRSFLLGKRANQDMGHILENIVYLELLRRGYTVYVGKTKDLEVDFVAKNREGLKYYQVALSVRDDKVLERELKSLQKTGDFYPKILLTMDMDLEADYNGIKKINVVDWLLSKEY